MDIIQPGTSEYEEADLFLLMAATVSNNSNGCYHSLCGAVVVSRAGEVIGSGFNSPPQGLESQRRCHLTDADFSERFHSDRTCCVHAEQRAIMDALRHNAHLLPNARLYFGRCDQVGQLQLSHDPRCTICSKLILDVGIREVVLSREAGITVYLAVEFNDLSFAY
ncbi:MAG: hypothetical protein Q7S64_03275 [bacterium]|nr:hypothetical protein [bacterium]